MGELDDEVEAIDAIFPECTKVLAEGILALKVPSHDEITVQLAFPQTYPDEKPSILQVTTESRRYPDPLYLEKSAILILDSVFSPGDVVLFEFIGELELFLQDYEMKHEEERKQQQEKELKQLKQKINALQLSSQCESDEQKDETASDVNYSRNGHTIKKSLTYQTDYTKGWAKSEPILDRGSTFIAYAREVHSVEEAKELLSSLTCDKKISRSAHNMNTWRIRGENGVTYQDCDDDGETAAGLRMLHLLTIMDAWNVIVVVSRWFGGTHIGPDRFKHINSATRDVLIRGGFFKEKSKK